MRRTDLLSVRIRAFQAEHQLLQAQVAERQKEVEGAPAQQLEIKRLISGYQETLAQSKVQYQEKNRPERPYSALARAHHKLGMWQGRLERLEKKQVKQEKQLKANQQQEQLSQMDIYHLQQRLKRFETDRQPNQRFPYSGCFSDRRGFRNT